MMTDQRVSVTCWTCGSRAKEILATAWLCRLSCCAVSSPSSISTIPAQIDRQKNANFIHTRKKLIIYIFLSYLECSSILVLRPPCTAWFPALTHLNQMNWSLSDISSAWWRADHLNQVCWRGGTSISCRIRPLPPWGTAVKNNKQCFISQGQSLGCSLFHLSVWSKFVPSLNSVLVNMSLFLSSASWPPHTIYWRNLNQLILFFLVD